MRARDPAGGTRPSAIDIARLNVSHPGRRWLISGYYRPILSSPAALLAGLQPCFTAPTFRTFCTPVYGMLARTAARGMREARLGASLSQIWPHRSDQRALAVYVCGFNPIRWAARHTVRRMTCADGR